MSLDSEVPFHFMFLPSSHKDETGAVILLYYAHKQLMPNFRSPLELSYMAWKDAFLLRAHEQTPF